MITGYNICIFVNNNRNIGASQNRPALVFIFVIAFTNLISPVLLNRVIPQMLLFE